MNEQWPDYWFARFQRQGFTVCDVIRPQIWRDTAIPFWYRQNALLFARKSRAGDLKNAAIVHEPPLALVHPDLYLRTLRAKRHPTRRPT